MKLCKTVTVTTALILSTTANAALVGRLAATEGGAVYQAYYDDVADLTWLADANYAMTSGYNTDGRMSWSSAISWAASLDIEGKTGWRIPTGAGYCDNSICTYSELGNMFYNVLGGEFGQSITVTHNTNFDLFTNLYSDSYWSSLTNWWDENSIYLDTTNGIQTLAPDSSRFFAWFVYSGDVSAIPVPAAVWLFGSGFVGLVGFARRKKA